MEATGFDAWVLTLAVFLPLVGALIMMVVPKAYELEVKLIGLGSSLAALAVGIYILFQFDYGSSSELQFVVDKGWIDIINSRYIIGLDGLSLPLLLLSLLVVPLCLVYSWNHVPSPGNPKAFFILLLILSTGMNGSFISQDMILFFVFFEIVLLPMYFLIGVWGGEERRYASLKFFLYTLFGSALMIISFLALFFLSKDAAGNPLQTFDMRLLTDAAGSGIVKTTQVWIFCWVI